MKACIFEVCTLSLKLDLFLTGKFYQDERKDGNLISIADSRMFNPRLPFSKWQSRVKSKYSLFFRVNDINY